MEKSDRMMSCDFKVAIREYVLDVNLSQGQQSCTTKIAFLKDFPNCGIVDVSMCWEHEVGFSDTHCHL